MKYTAGRRCAILLRLPALNGGCVAAKVWCANAAKPNSKAQDPSGVNKTFCSATCSIEF
jgi:hypothetical protein